MWGGVFWRILISISHAQDQFIILVPFVLHTQNSYDVSAHDTSCLLRKPHVSVVSPTPLYESPFVFPSRVIFEFRVLHVPFGRSG
jgi:hypothetical protein